MSKLLWKSLMTPDLSQVSTSLEDNVYHSLVENVRLYPESSDKIAIPDAKAFRSMSRASVFLSHICMRAQTVLAEYLAQDPFSVGIYCAVENGPIDAPSTAKILQQKDPEHFADLYRKFRNPKMYLKQLPNLVPAQMGISLGIRGPMNVYTHSTAGSLHALDQAEWDLDQGIVKVALVCTAHAFDDFLIVRRTRQSDSRCLNEGAAAAVLTRSDKKTDWSQSIKDDEKNYFGISDFIIKALNH